MISKSLLLSILSCSLAFSFGVPFAAAQAQTPATLFFLPGMVTVAQNQTVWMDVMVNTGGQKANAMAASFSYPVDKMEILEVSTAGSETLTTIVAPSVFGGGKAKIAGGSADGFSGVKKVASVRLQAKVSSGTATLTFLGDSAVLLEANSSNIFSLVSSTGGVINFRPPLAPTPIPTPTPTPTSTPQPVPSPVAPQPSPQPSGLTISDIRAERVSDESVLISWKTNEETSGQVNYGPTSQDDYAFSVLDSSFANEHSLLLLNVKSSEDYSFEIIGLDKAGQRIQEGRLALADFLVQQVQQKPFEVVEGQVEIGGFEIRFPLLVIFVLLPVLVVLLVAFLLFQRMRSRVEG